MKIAELAECEECGGYMGRGRHGRRCRECLDREDAAGVGPDEGLVDLADLMTDRENEVAA